MKRATQIGLAMMIGMVAIAILAATSAMATSTSLCKVHEEPCGVKHQVGAIHLELPSSEVLLLEVRGGAGYDILCLGVLAEIDAGALATPQELSILQLNYSSCGTEGSGGSHSNCTVVMALHLPWAADLLKTALNLGTLEILKGEEGEPVTLLKCTVFGFIKVECELSSEQLGFHVDGATAESNGLVLAEGLLPKIAGGSLCPEETEITLGALEPPGISKVKVKVTSLCKKHEAPCKTMPKTVDLITNEPPVLLNSIANVECSKSLASASVLTSEGAQVLDLSELTWVECHTQGAADNCTVSTTTLPKWSVSQTALNLGTVTQTSGAVKVKCEILGLHEFSCIYGGEVAFSFEGAKHTGGAGNGMLTASKASVKRTEAKEGCPETAKWDLLYEPGEALYLIVEEVEKTTKTGEPIYIVS